MSNLDHLPGPPGLPLIGNSLRMRKTKLLEQLAKWTDQYGSVYRISFGSHREVVILSDPILTQELLKDRPEGFRRSSAISEILVELGIDGVFVAEGDSWKNQRRLVNPATHPTLIRTIFPEMRKMTERLLKRWEGMENRLKGENIARDLRGFMLDITIVLTMGKSVEELDDENTQSLRRDLELIFSVVASRVTSPFPLWRYFPTRRDRKVKRALQRTTSALRNFVDTARVRMSEDDWKEPQNLLEMLIDERDKDESGMTDEDVLGNIFTMVLGGLDTTATSMAWGLIMLANEPQVVSRLRAEAHEAFGHESMADNYDQLSQLPEMESVIKEVLRVKPSIPLLALEPLKNIKLHQYNLPAGTPIVADLRGGARNPHLFADPQAFRPCRWHEAASNDNPGVKCGTLPFGSGPRFCPGRVLAVTAIRLVMTMVVTNFEIRPTNKKNTVSEIFNFSMIPSYLPVELVPLRHG